MREHQEEREKRRRLNEQLMQKALAPAQSYFPGRSMKALTEPEEFHFHTEKREQLRALSYQKEAEDTIVHENCIPGSGDFIYSADRISGKGHANDKFSNTQIGKHCSLKRKRTPGTETIGRLTVPSPFNFASEERALQRGTTSTENEPYVPLLQQTLEYSTRTPKRFRTACDYVKTSRKSEPSISRPTIPEAFHFETEERSQIYPREEVLSSSEREILEMEKMSKFKARPLDRRIFENGGALGIRKVDKMPTTVPQCFSLATDNRIRNAVDLASSSSSFDDCREDPLARTTSKEQSWKPVLTEPRSPNLATKNRAMLSLSQHSNSEVPKDHSFFHARPVPTGSPFRPTNVPKELTKPEPIQLRTEDRALRHEKELAEAVEKMRREEESARIFKAKPMRIVEHPLVPEKIRKSTITDPFPLCTEERGIVAANKFKIKVDKRLQEEYERAQFRAKPFVTKVPFEPAKSTRPLTEIREVTLNSDQRALKRQDFDNFLLQKEISYQLAKRKLDEERRVCFLPDCMFLISLHRHSLLVYFEGGRNEGTYRV